MARNNSRRNDGPSSFSNFGPTIIRAKTTKSEPRRFGKNDNVLSMSVAVSQMSFGDDSPSVNFLELRFFNKHADAIEANFGDGGPFSGGGHYINIVAGPLFIEHPTDKDGNPYLSKAGSRNGDEVIVEIDGEEYSSEEVEIKLPMVRYVMNPLDVTVSLMQNEVEGDFELSFVGGRSNDDDDDDDDDRGSRSSRRKKSSSSSRKRKRDEEDDEEEDDEDESEEDEDDEDEAEDADDDDDEDDEPARKPRSRGGRSGRSSRRSSRRSR